MQYFTDIPKFLNIFEILSSIHSKHTLNKDVSISRPKLTVESENEVQIVITQHSNAKIYDFLEPGAKIWGKIMKI